ncbi:MAG TPA: hypothetical protein VNI57_07805 [Candidatus Saccharimonadales bacterium]|nr:hypothetical protein [Candidatus Saccharimonadales bacterium]
MRTTFRREPPLSRSFEGSSGPAPSRAAAVLLVERHAAMTKGEAFGLPGSEPRSLGVG